MSKQNHNVIKLFEQNGLWHAKYKGAKAQEIKQLFGTDILPTAYSTQTMSKTVVVGIIQDLNRDCFVYAQ